MSEIAYTVQGRPITVAQRDAGLAAMAGTFRAGKIASAMARAGVIDLPGQSYTAERAADRLIQFERKAGRIRFHAGLWSKVPA